MARRQSSGTVSESWSEAPRTGFPQELTVSVNTALDPSNHHTAANATNGSGLSPRGIGLTSPSNKGFVLKEMSPFEFEDDDLLGGHAGDMHDITPRRAIKRTKYVSALVLVYIAVGCVLVMYNKWILTTLGFTFPITMILTHLTCSGSLALGLVWTLYKSRLRVEEYWFQNISRHTLITKIVPPGILLGLDIVCSSAAVEYSSVSLVEVVKSGVPMLVLIFGICTRQESFSFLKFVVISTLSLGIFLTSYGEFSLDYRGLFLALFATICGAVRLILMQMLLSNSTASTHGKLNPLLSLSYFAPISAISLFFPWIGLEAHRLFHSQFVHEAAGNMVLVLGIGVLLAFMLNYVELLIVEAANALTMCMAGVIKLIILIFVSALVFSYHFTASNIAGIILAIFGVIGYNYIRFKDQLGPDSSFERVNETEEAFVSE